MSYIFSRFSNYNIASSSSEELLGLVNYSKVTFSKHIEDLCRRTKQKLQALARAANFMTLEKHRLVMKTFVFSQFKYCSVVWMCHRGKCKDKLNILKEEV